MQTRTDGGRYGLGQWLALAIGATYTLVGLAGFAVTGFDDFAGRTHETLLGFEVNGLHNVVHLIIGIAGLAMWRRADTARTFGWLLFAGYGLTFVYGLVVAGKDASDGNFLSINAADNGLHLVSAIAGIVVAQTAYRGLRTAASARTTGGRTSTTAGR